MPRLVLAGVAVLIWGMGTAASYAGPTVQPVAFAVTGAVTTRPIGHAVFCKTHPTECGANTDMVDEMPMTPGRLAELKGINSDFNSSIRAVTDRDFYHRDELWAYPVKAGDCEDIVLAKRRALNQAGWPMSTLLITVVRQKSGAGHAVLTVRTSEGDLVLDNLDNTVKAWNETPYTYLKRQSQANAGEWVAINDDRDVQIVAGTNSH